MWVLFLFERSLESGTTRATFPTFVMFDFSSILVIYFREIGNTYLRDVFRIGDGLWRIGLRI